MLGACLFLFTGLLLAQEEPSPTSENVPAEQSADASAAVTDSGDSADDHKYAMLIAGLTIFVISIFVGVEVITKVPQKLHTPLMSGSNAISGIAIVGAITATQFDTEIAKWLGLAALIFATINVIGGFLVTDRMLKMFKRK